MKLAEPYIVGGTDPSGCSSPLFRDGEDAGPSLGGPTSPRQCGHGIAGVVFHCWTTSNAAFLGDLIEPFVNGTFGSAHSPQVLNHRIDQLWSAVIFNRHRASHHLVAGQRSKGSDGLKNRTEQANILLTSYIQDFI